MVQHAQNPATTSDDGAPQTFKVTMNLTDRDRQNAECIQWRTAARTKADAVSTALSLTRFIVDQLGEGNAELLLRRLDDKSLERIVMPELQYLRSSSVTDRTA